jgi:hypothetical protein
LGWPSIGCMVLSFPNLPREKLGLRISYQFYGAMLVVGLLGKVLKFPTSFDMASFTFTLDTGTFQISHNVKECILLFNKCARGKEGGPRHLILQLYH